MEDYPETNTTPETAQDPTSLYLAELAHEWGLERLEPLSESDITLLHASFTHARETGSRYDLDTRIEDTADDFARQNPQFIKNARAIREGIRSKELEAQTRAYQQQAFEQAKRAVLLQANLPGELSKDEYQTAKDNIRARLIAAHEEQGEAFDPLTTLGMLTKDEKGREHFTWPAPGTFPSSTDQKWQTYLRAVRNHVAAASHLERGTSGATRQAVEEADRFRTHAHNDVSGEVKDLLELDWELEDVRRLVAKVRDNRFPTTETSEKARTNRAIGRHILDVDDTVSSAMRRHLYTQAYGSDALLIDPENDGHISYS